MSDTGRASLPARELAHAALGQGWFRCGLLDGLRRHDDLCEALTAAIEQRDREHAVGVEGLRADLTACRIRLERLRGVTDALYAADAMALAIESILDEFTHEDAEDGCGTDHVGECPLAEPQRARVTYLAAKAVVREGLMAGEAGNASAEVAARGSDLSTVKGAP